MSNKIHIKNPGKKGLWYRAYSDQEGISVCRIFIYRKGLDLLALILMDKK